MHNRIKRIVGLTLLITALTVAAGPSLPPAAVGAAEKPYNFTTIDPPGAKDGNALDISPGGEIVGNYLSSVDNKWHGFVLRGGEFATIDYPRNDVTLIRPGGIAPSGDITGWYSANVSGVITQHGFLLTRKGEWSTVDYPGQPNTQWFRILPDGSLVGCYSTVPNTASMRAVVMSRDGNVELDRPFACHLSATSDGKVLVGYYREGPNYAANRAYVIDNGVFTPIPFPGSLHSLAFDISPDGRIIVGSYNYDGVTTHGFMVERRGASVADWEFTTIDMPGAILTQVYGCNQAGDLVGRYKDSTGFHLFLASRTSGK